MNYSKYKKAQELDNVIKNTEDLIRKAEAFSKKIDEVEERVAMIVVGNNRLYFALTRTLPRCSFCSSTSTCCRTWRTRRRSSNHSNLCHE